LIDWLLQLAGNSPAVDAQSNETTTAKTPASNSTVVTESSADNHTLGDGYSMASVSSASETTVAPSVNGTDEETKLATTVAWCMYAFISQNSTWSSRLDTYDVSSPCILAVPSLSNSTVRHDELDWLDAHLSSLCNLYKVMICKLLTNFLKYTSI